MWWRLSVVLLLLWAGVLPARAQSSPAPTVYVFPLFADGTLGGTPADCLDHPAANYRERPYRLAPILAS